MPEDLGSSLWVSLPVVLTGREYGDCPKDPNMGKEGFKPKRKTNLDSGVK